MTSSSNVSLQMIVKDEVEEVSRLLDNAHNYFDGIFLTVSDETAAKDLELYALDQMYENVKVDYRPWTDNFADARNHNWKLGENYEYSFWLDADDSYDFRTIPSMVELAREQGIAAIYLPYNYAQDQYGRSIARHWRERLIWRSHSFEWRGAVHETLISDEPYKSIKLNHEVVHNATHKVESSKQRNHAILVKQAEVDNPDPRDLHYLGLSYFAMGAYRECIGTLERYISVSGWDEEVYRSMTIMSEAGYQLDDFNIANKYALQAMALKPEYPQAYWLMAQYENDQDNFREALEWVKVAETKPIPETMSIVDPTCVGRSRLIGAQACYMLGRYQEAYQWLMKSDDPMGFHLRESFKSMANTDTFLKLLPQVRQYFTDDKSLWDALADDLKYDTRVRGLRQAAVKPKTWSDKSIVFFCGQGYEEWGPHTLDKGMGGSEEAVVYLSRELAKLGWEVTVYGEVEAPVVDNFGDSEIVDVQYLPWRHIDTRDDFNVFVAWRQPKFAEHVKAKKKIIDLHDVMPEEMITPTDATYFVKSQYHRDLYPNLPDSDVHIIGNGIVEEQFHG